MDVLVADELFTAEFLLHLRPTGRTLRRSGATIHHMVCGKISKTWLVVDNLDLLQQLGAVSQQNQAT